MVGITVGISVASANARLDALGHAEHHALGMRVDSLRSALAAAIADLRLGAALTSMRVYVGAPNSPAHDLREELQVLVAVHPEYREAAVVLADGRVGLHIVGHAPAPQESADPQGDGGAFAALTRSRPWTDQEAFIACGSPGEHPGHQYEDAQLELLPLLAGVQMRSTDAMPIAAVALRLDWQPLLRRYAGGHPDSQSFPALRIGELPPLVQSDPIRGT